MHLIALEKLLARYLAFCLSCPVPRQEEFSVEKPIEHLAQPEEEVMVVEGTNTGGSSFDCTRHPPLKWLKVLVVAGEAAGDRQLPVRYRRSVEQVQLLINKSVLLLNPLRDHMLVCAVLAAKPAPAKKTGEETELPL